MESNKKKVNVTDQTYEKIMQMILSGSMRPGERIPSENELKDIYGVSRNTIRTVLNRLNVLGILETRRGEGTFLKSLGTEVYLNNFVPSILINSTDLLGLMEFRRGVETASARLAAINATKEDIEDLELYFKELQHKDVSNHEFATKTSNFHLKIAIASKNELFVRLLELIKWIMTSKMEDFLYFKPNVEDSSFYHSMVFRCIKQRKADEAAYMMDRHMMLLLERVEDYIEYTRNHPHVNPNSLVDLKNVTNIYNGREENYNGKNTG
ncbi:MAG: FadR family transcriptional regulator [Clostridiaceae bacterium]|nr:FadR family transcriptional regulator [Clostridiaceae bacterium]